jgi:predicted dehydrogenase
VDLVGWADLDSDRCRVGLDELETPHVPIGDDFTTLAASQSPDFVLDATTPDAHHGVTVTALGMGLPVLGEKPMATSLEDAREMVRASERAGRLYMVSQNRRYNPHLVAFREAVARVAPMHWLNAEFFIGPRFGDGFREQMAHPLLLDMGVHHFDTARLLARSEPESVLAEEWNPPGSWFREGAAAQASFLFEDGLRFTYRGSWCAEGAPTSWNAAWRAVCLNGTALWDGERNVWSERVTGEEGFLRPVSSETTTGVEEGYAWDIAGSLREFLEALETGKAPQGECHDNFRTMAMVFAAAESARTGVRADVPRLEGG